MDRLIRQGRTGTQSEFANRLGLSVSRLARIIEYMKEIGAPLEYDRSRNTYYYQQEYSIQIKVDIQQLDHQQISHISAGSYNLSNNIFNAFFGALNNTNLVLLINEAVLRKGLI
jgi:predicted DNA-binding transcriptional regulator YafY